METIMYIVLVYILGLRASQPWIMENQIDKKMETDMETLGPLKGCIG